MMALQLAKTYPELISEAKEAEANDRIDNAISSYTKAIQQQPLEAYSYHRLMILYRKERRYEEELSIIKKGIHTFQTHHRDRSEKLLAKNTTAQKLSKSLARSLGLIDTKGNDTYQPEPIASWMKRQQIVEKKIGLTATSKKSAVKSATSTVSKKQVRKTTKAAPQKSRKK